MKSIEVKLSLCCQLFTFNLRGKTVICSHLNSNYQIKSWEKEGDIRILKYPFELPDDEIIAHKKLTKYLKNLGEFEEGYDIGAFFNLPIP